MRLCVYSDNQDETRFFWGGQMEQRRLIQSSADINARTDAGSLPADSARKTMPYADMKCIGN